MTKPEASKQLNTKLQVFETHGFDVWYVFDGKGALDTFIVEFDDNTHFMWSDLCSEYIYKRKSSDPDTFQSFKTENRTNHLRCLPIKSGTIIKAYLTGKSEASVLLSIVKNIIIDNRVLR